MIRARIEMPAGAGRTLRLGRSMGALRDGGVLPAPTPFPYGSLPGIPGDDGDALDCWVLTDERLATGQELLVEIVGLVEQFEDGIADARVLLALPGEVRWLTLEGEAGADAEGRIRAWMSAAAAARPGDVRIGATFDRAEATRYVAERMRPAQA